MIDTSITIEKLNKGNKNNMAAALGIEFTEIDKMHLKAKMPVDDRTVQPMGVLHGGANAALAETLGSMASYLSVDRENFVCLGMEIKCNHLRSASSGYVYGTSTPLHIGKKTHVWQIKIEDEKGNLTCFSTLTLAVIPIDDKMREKHKARKMEF